MNTFEVKMEWFYENDDEKIKINWLCYEYACDIYDFIKGNNRLAFFIKKHSNKDIAKFCEYFSKNIKDNISNDLIDLSAITSFCEKHIADYYPRNIQMINEYLFDAAKQAWNNIKTNCQSCPEKCIEDRNSRSIYFDRYK